MVAGSDIAYVDRAVIREERGMIDRVGEEQRICEKSLELRGLLDRAQVPLLQLVEHRGRNRRVPPHLVQHHGDEPNRSARRLPPRRRRRRQAEESA